MNRKEPIVVALGLVVMLANAHGAFAQSSCGSLAGGALGAGVGALAGSAVDQAAARKSAKRIDPRAQELMAILNETQSIDTLFVTVKVLESMGPPAKPAVPAVIRNAERLGLLKGLSGDHAEHSRKGKLGMEVVEALVKISESKRDGGSVCAKHYPPACCVPCCPAASGAPCCPAPLPATTSWSAPAATPPAVLPQ